MCNCPAHHALVDCTGCSCDHGPDRIAQWKARAKELEAEVKQLEAKLVLRALDSGVGELMQRAEQAEAERDALKAAIERAKVELDELDCGTSLAVDLKLLDPPDLTVVRHVTARIRDALNAPSGADSPTDAEEDDQWRRDEQEIDGGFSGNEFPRLWPPRRAPETTRPAGTATHGTDSPATAPQTTTAQEGPR